MNSHGCDFNLAVIEKDGLKVSQVPAVEKVSAHDAEPVGTHRDVQIPEYDWVPVDWETKNDPKIPEADVSKENIGETTHVSLGTS